MRTNPERVRAFRALHESGCFVMPNPWDLGSAQILVGLGFKALATASSGFAWSTGRPDTTIPLTDILAHFRQMASGVGVPVSGDFEAGHASEPLEAAANVTAALKTGIAGISIEDSTGDPANPLFEFPLAVERVHAARQAIDRSKTGVLLTARSEGFMVDRPDLGETIRRLTAYAEAGADCLYAPGLRTMADISAVVRAVAPKPVNVQVVGDFTTVAQLAEAGVRRISVGGALARVAWASFLEAAREIALKGAFTSLARAVPVAEINELFR
jgi:2-methylisocitrate lyase-like PEP mutase family enzyme